jgi:formiminotetrahydrofolate cyclodeaminase
MDDDSLARRTAADLLDEVAADQLAPGAGAVASLTAALAAAAVESVAKLSRRSSVELPGAVEVADRAAELRERLVLLADANADAFAEASRSLGRENPDDPGRDGRLGSDLARAAYTPLSIAEVAADVAELAASLAAKASHDLRADAAVAACLAEGAVRGAAELVRVNLGVGDQDERVARVNEYVTSAAGARERALAG